LTETASELAAESANPMYMLTDDCGMSKWM
jgi:hypothetical protein